MPILSFDIYSNYEEVIRLRNEITMLENRLKTFGPGTSINTIRAVENQLRSARTSFNALSMDAARAGASLEMNIRKGAQGAMNAINQLKDTLSSPLEGLGAIAGIAGLGAFLNQITKIRGEFQQMETSINVLVGEKKGESLMNQLTEFAKRSPLDFKGTVNGAQMMLGFGIDADKVPRYLEAIGDVAMGDAQRFNSLTLAFSQMSAAGKLMGQDLMQMVNAGFQPLQVIAEKTGKSIGQLKDEMSQGKISSEMVQQAFIDATSAGGKFYQMSEKASQTIPGQMSMLGDAIDLMFNDLGKKSEGTIIKVIQGATALIENYEKVGGILGTVIAAYGIYKASVMASEFAIQKQAEDSSKAIVQGFEEQLAKMEEYRREKELLAYDDDVRSSLQTGSISQDFADKIQAMRDELKVQVELKQAAKDQAEAQVKAAKEVVSAAEERVEAAQELVDIAEQIGDAEEQAAAQQELMTATRRLDVAQTELQTAQENAHTASVELSTAQTQLNSVATNANVAATNANTAAQTANTAAQGRNAVVTALITAKTKAATVAQHLWTGAVNMTTKAVNSLKVAWATNPIGLIITALTTAIGLFMTFRKETEETTAEVTKFGESAVKTQRNVDTLYAVLDSVNKDSKVYKDSLNELTKIAEEYGIVIDKEKDTLDQLIEKRGILNDLILKEGEARQMANRIATYQEEKTGYIDNFIKQMTEVIDDESKGEAEKNASRFAQMIADKVERDLQDETNGKIKGLVQHWKDLEKELSSLDWGNAKTAEDNARLSEQARVLRQQIAETQTEIAQAANSEAKAFADQMGWLNDYKLDIKDTAGFVRELTDKVNVTNQFIDQTKKNAQEVQAELDAMKAPTPDFSAAGMEVNELIEKYKEFNKELNTINEAEVKPAVDSSEINNATESAEKAQEEVNNLDNSSATPSTDTTQIDEVTGSAVSASSAMNVLDKTSAEPVVKTKWLDNFTSKINDAWVGLQKLFGVENPEPLIKSNQTVANNQPKSQKSKAQDAISSIKEEFEKKIKDSKTTNEKQEIRKAINTLMGDLDQKSSDYKYFEGLLKKLDTSDATKNKGKSSSGGDDPKQRAYEIAQAEKAEQERIAKLKRDEQQRQIDQSIAIMVEGTAKEIATIRNEAHKKRTALLDERQKEADALKKFDMQQWLKGGKGRKAYQWKQLLSDDEYLAKAGQNIGYDSRLFDINFNESNDVSKLKNTQAQNLRDQFQVFNDYLKQYGTYQQKRLAIAEEYAAKIRKAEEEAEKNSDVENLAEQKKLLEKERDMALAGVRTAEIRANIDWSVVFGEFGGMFHDVLAPQLQDLKEYIQTDEFKNSDADSQKAIIDAMQQMESALGSADKVSFSKLGKEIQDYEGIMKKLKAAELDYASKYAIMTDAQKKYIDAVKSGTEEEIQIAKNNLEAAKLSLETSETNIQNIQQTAQETQQAISETATGLKTAMDNVVGGLQGLASGSISGAFQGLKTFSAGMKSLEGVPKGLSNIFEKISDKLESVPILGWVVSIIDIFKDGVSVVVTGIIDAVFNAISGIISDVLNFKDGLFRQLGESLAKGIANIFQSIFTLGGWFDWIGNGSSDKTLERDMERLTLTNEALINAINNLAEKLAESSLADATDIYEDQRKKMIAAMNNTQELMQRAGAVKDKFMGITIHRSSNTKINDSMGSNDWSRISQIVGKTVNSAESFFQLTSEQMAKIADEAPDLYAKIKDIADDGYGDAAQYMDEYISYYKQLKELEDAYRAKLTDTSFDNIKDSFKSTLLDMESDAKDFAKNFEAMLQQAVISSMMSDTYNKRLEDWYKNFSDAMEGDGLSVYEQNQLRTEWDKIVNDALAERNQLMEMMGWDSSPYSQEASSRGFQALSQDVGLEINGRLTAIQEATEAIRAMESEKGLSLAQITNDVLQMLQNHTSFLNHFTNIEAQIAKCYLEIVTIRENTGSMVDYMKDMQSDMESVKKLIKDKL